MHQLDEKKLTEVIAGRKGSQRYVNIRKAARRLYLKSDRQQCCVVCGYDRHFEVSHIKPICDFDGDTLIKVINHLDNLVALCPTHHWELDHGMLRVGPAGLEPATVEL